MSQGGDRFGFEFRGGEVGDEGFEEGYVVASWLEREVGFSTNDEVGGLEVGEGSNHLGCVEGWVEWCLASSVPAQSSAEWFTDQDCTQFEEGICGLVHISRNSLNRGGGGGGGLAVR